MILNRNPAVIKQDFSRMKKSDFIRNAQKIKEILLNIETNSVNANYRFAMLSLYRWCIAEYKRKFQ